MALVAAPVAAHNGKVAWAYPASGIVLDGDFWDWPDGLPIYPVGHPEHGDLPRDAADLTASFRIVWDRIDSTLYLAVDVRDDSPVLGAATLFEWRQYDGLEVYFALDPEAYGANWQESLYGTSRHSIGGRNAPPGEIVAQSSATGRRYEVRLNLAPSAAAYSDIAFDLVVCDKDADGSFSWVAWGPYISKLARPERMGDVLLLDRPANVERALASMDSLQHHSVTDVRGDTQRNASTQMFFTGVLLTVAVLHLLLVLFGSQRGTNLYYAAFSSSAAAVIYISFSNSLSIASWLHKDPLTILMIAGVSGVGIFGLLFLYSLFFGRIPRHFWILLAALLGSVILVIYLSLYQLTFSWETVSRDAAVAFIFGFPMFILIIEALRVLTLALVRRRDGARIICAGVFAFFLYAVLAVMDRSFGLLSGVLIPILSVSIYLARDVARVRRTLETRLVQIRELSMRTNEQNRALEQTNRALAAANEQVEMASHHKSEFLARMSHDLRTPMNAIIGYTRILLRQAKERLTERQYRNLDNIQISADNLLSLINDILDLSKIEAGHIDIKPEEVDLQQLATECIASVESLVQPGVQLERQLAATRPVHTDADRTRRVVMNLLSNALKFTEKGTITVSLKAHGEGVELTVADTGSGIPAGDVPHIFDEFRQVEGESGKPQEGTGLGLSIAKKSVDLLGGEISVESQVGKGTKFTLRLRDYAEKKVE